MGTRVLSLWLPYLSIDRDRHEGMLSRRKSPRAICLDDEESRPLVAVCQRAERAGLQPGMTSDEASRRVSGLIVSPADPTRDRQFLETCISWCERYTPFVALDQSVSGQRGSALWLDIGDSAHFSGGEANLLAGLLGRLKRMGLTAKAAIADHPGSAWAACRFGGDEQRILPVNGARVALASWPVAALRLQKADCDKLESAGIERIEHLYALPRRAIAARFGDHVATRLDRALGLVDEPIALDTPLPAQQAQMIFADPITDPNALPLLVERLLHQLCVGLEAAGLGARRLTLALYRVDNSTVTCSVGVDRPSRDMHHLSALVGDRFDDIDLGFGLARAILDAVEIEPLLSERLCWRGLGTAADEAGPDLAQCRPMSPARIERRERLQPCQGAERDLALRPPLPPFLRTEPMPGQAPQHAGGRSAATIVLSPMEVEQSALQETPPRPLRLLRQPEAIEAIASLPDEPPVLFRWRQRLHKVTGARGPETVAPDWWRTPEAERPERLPSSQNAAERHDAAPGSRDYFAVEDSEGARFWLFREGSYGAGAEPLPRWFLHGVFG